MRILLTGKSGQIGSALERVLKPVGEVAAFGRAEMDLLQPKAIREKLRQVIPDVVINAAATTAVDRAEAERASAFAINAAAVAVLAEEAKRAGALLVHFSTDYVFDGEKPGRYTEEDAPRPLSVYGESKLAGERVIAESGCRHLIFRTSWVYSERGRNFPRAILDSAQEKKELRVVSDQRGAPTSADTIARAVVSILMKGNPATGLYHMSAAGETTWHGFAKEIFSRLGIETRVVPIPSSEYQAAAARPKNSLLDNAKLQREFGIVLPDWREGLAEVSSKIKRF